MQLENKVAKAAARLEAQKSSPPSQISIASVEPAYLFLSLFKKRDKNLMYEAFISDLKYHHKDDGFFLCLFRQSIIHLQCRFVELSTENNGQVLINNFIVSQ